LLFLNPTIIPENPPAVNPLGVDKQQKASKIALLCIFIKKSIMKNRSESNEGGKLLNWKAAVAFAALSCATGCIDPDDGFTPVGDDDDTSCEDIDVSDVPLDIEISDTGNTLRKTIEVHTGESVTITADFGRSSGNPEWTLDGDEMECAKVDDHQECTVFGLRAEEEYFLRVTAVYNDCSAQVSEVLPFETGTLPFPNLITETEIPNPELVQEGHTLMNFGIQEGKSPEPIVVILDQNGEIIWYHTWSDYEDITEGRGTDNIQTSLDANGKIHAGGGLQEGLRPMQLSLAGEVIPTGPPQFNVFENVTSHMHHIWFKLPQADHPLSGGFVTAAQDQDIFYSKVLILNPSVDYSSIDNLEDHALFSWSSAEIADRIAGHGLINSVDVKFEENAAYINLYDGTIAKVDLTTREVLWLFGEQGEFQMTDGSFFGPTHDVNVLDNGNILLFDNGPDGTESRAVEYELDTQNMTAKEVLSYWLGTHVQSGGSAQRLSNGNTLIGPGCGTGVVDAPILKEVTPEGKVVWEKTLLVEDEYFAGAYIATRIDAIINEANPE